MTVTRHEFLAQLHELLRPRRYLETGVQRGTSLNLAIYSELAIGIDPFPLCQAFGKQQIFTMTADDFFQYHMAPEDQIDFAFVDGSHLFEDALRDFINIEHYSHETTVVVFDDVLPYSQDIAYRQMIPGHWTGDVWKIYCILTKYRPDLTIHLIDTSPTGTMVVWGMNPTSSVLPLGYMDIVEQWVEIDIVPEDILTRRNVVSPEAILSKLSEMEIAT